MAGALLLPSGILSARSAVRECAEHYACGNLDEARAALAQAADGKIPSAELEREMAVLSEEAGDWEGAARLFNSAASHSGDEQLQIEEASCLARGGRWEEAIRLLLTFLEQPPGHPDALWELALLHRSLAKRGGWEKRDARSEWRLAKGCLQALVAQRPEWGAAQMLLGECDENLGDLAGALAAYQDALSLEPSYKHLNAAVARLLRRQGRSAEALTWYEKATSVDPGNELIRKEKASLVRRYPRLARRQKAARERQWEAVTPPQETALPASSVTIRVGLETHMTRVVIRGGGELKVLTSAGVEIRRLEGACDLVVRWRNGEGTILDDRKREQLTFQDPIRIEPVSEADTIAVHAVSSGSGYFFAGESDRAYRGILEIHPGPGKGFSLVNVVPLECYVAGVLPSEMPSHWPLEALKAQAVAARTDVLSKLGRHRAEGFDVCDEVHCMAYRGIQAERPGTNRAVSETAGIVLRRGSGPFPAVYSAQCGGRTQSFLDAWGRNAPVVGVADYDDSCSPGEFPLPPWELDRWVREGSGAYCDQPQLKGYRNFRWVTLVGAARLQASERLKGIGRIRSVRVTHRSEAGWANELTFTGEKGERKITNDTIRGVLGGLRSNLICLEPWFDESGNLDEIIVYGGGWGHGVGMCQVGACGLAKRGWDFRRILEHYYPEASFKKLKVEEGTPR